MSNYAYTDAARTQKIFANSNNIMSYKGVRCYCKNPKCNARIFIYKPEHPSTAYFKASGKPAHIGNCGIKHLSFNQNDYDPTLFSFPNVLMDLEIPVAPSTKHSSTGKGTGTISSDPKPLKTLKEIYSMCTNTPINDCYNGIRISNIIADERNESNFPNGFNGYRIAECTFFRYEPSTHSILMNFTKYLKGSDPLYYIQLNFNDNDLYDKMCARIKSTEHDTGIIVVSGNWEMIDEPSGYKLNIKSKCTINSEKQIAVIKKG